MGKNTTLVVVVAATVVVVMVMECGREGEHPLDGVGRLLRACTLRPQVIAASEVAWL